MLEFLRRALKSEFLRNNFILFIGAVAVGALNYVYYPILGRIVSPAVFGEVQTLVSLFLQLSAFLGGLSIFTVGLVVNTRSDNETSQAIIDFEKITILVGLALLFLTALAAPMLKVFFQFEATLPFVALALALVVSVPFTFRSGYLRGKKRFGQVTAANVVLAGAKLVLSVGLVVFGLGAAGAMFGLVGAQLLAALVAGYWAFKAGLFSPQWWSYIKHKPSISRVKPQLKYAAAVLAVSLVVTLQYSADIIFIKHFLDPHEAGLYAGIATVGRIVLFLTASVVQVMLPGIKVGGQNAPLLQKSLLLFVVICAPVLIFCIATPHIATELLMGSQYSAYSSLLPLLTIAITIVALLNLLLNYFVAKKQYATVFVGVMGSLLTIVLMAGGDRSAFSVVLGLLWGSLGMLGLLVVWFGFTKFKRGQA